MSEEIGGVFMVLRKLRKREPMSTDELDLAKQSVADRRSLMAYPPGFTSSPSAASTSSAALNICMEPHRPSEHFSV